MSEKAQSIDPHPPRVRAGGDVRLHYRRRGGDVSILLHGSRVWYYGGTG